MSGSSDLLTDEDRTLLLRMSKLLEEITDTFEILEDGVPLKCIRGAEEDMKVGNERRSISYLCKS